jgi:hypothetical protein
MRRDIMAFIAEYDQMAATVVDQVKDMTNENLVEILSVLNDQLHSEDQETVFIAMCASAGLGLGLMKRFKPDEEEDE